MTYVTGTAATVALLGAAVESFLLDRGWAYPLRIDGITPICTGAAGAGGYNFLLYLPNDAPAGDDYQLLIGMRFRPPHEVAAPFNGNYAGAVIDCIPATNSIPEHLDWYGHQHQPEFVSNTIPVGVSAPIADSNIPYQFFSDADGKAIVLCFGRGGFYNFIAFGIDSTFVKWGPGGWDGGAWLCGARPAVEGAKSSSSGGVEMGFSLPPYPPGSGGVSASPPRCVIRARRPEDSTIDWIASAPDGTDHGSCMSRLGAGMTCLVGTTAIGGNGSSEPMPFMGNLVARAFSQMAGQVQLFPAVFGAARDDGGFSPLGQLPLLYAALTKDHLAMGAQVTIGSDNYRVFGTFAVRQIDG